MYKITILMILFAKTLAENKAMEETPKMLDLATDAFQRNTIIPFKYLNVASSSFVVAISLLHHFRIKNE